MNHVAAGILSAVGPWIPARRKWRGKVPDALPPAAIVPGGKMPALYGWQDARRRFSGVQFAPTFRLGFSLAM